MPHICVALSINMTVAWAMFRLIIYDIIYMQLKSS